MTQPNAQPTLAGRLLWVTLLAPTLLAPVYYQGGTAPTQDQATTLAPTSLPAAIPFTSPLLVTPTTLPEASEDTSATTPEAALPPPPAPQGVFDAVACAQGLGVMQDLAALAYQRNAKGNYMSVLVAAGLVRQQVIDGTTPNLLVLRKRLHALPWGAHLRDEFLQAYALLEAPCSPVDGSTFQQKPSVPRPN